MYPHHGSFNDQAGANTFHGAGGQYQGNFHMQQMELYNNGQLPSPHYAPQGFRDPRFTRRNPNAQKLKKLRHNSNAMGNNTIGAGPFDDGQHSPLKNNAKRSYVTRNHLGQKVHRVMLNDSHNSTSQHPDSTYGSYENYNQYTQGASPGTYNNPHMQQSPHFETEESFSDYYKDSPLHVNDQGSSIYKGPPTNSTASNMNNVSMEHYGANNFGGSPVSSSMYGNPNIGSEINSILPKPNYHGAPPQNMMSMSMSPMGGKKGTGRKKTNGSNKDKTETFSPLKNENNAFYKLYVQNNVSTAMRNANNQMQRKLVKAMKNSDNLCLSIKLLFERTIVFFF